MADSENLQNFGDKRRNIVSIQKICKIPEKKSDKGGAFIVKEYRQFCNSRNIEIEYCTSRMHTENRVVERAIQTIEILILANMEDGICLTESVNRELRAMRFTIHRGFQIKPFELHHGRKPRTELTNIVKDGKTYLSNCFSTEHTKNSNLCGP